MHICSRRLGFLALDPHFLEGGGDGLREREAFFLVDFD